MRKSEEKKYKPANIKYPAGNLSEMRFTYLDLYLYRGADSVCLLFPFSTTSSQVTSAVCVYKCAYSEFYNALFLLHLKYT